MNQRGAQMLAIISGPSGMGKSSLMASALKAFQRRPTLIALGKAEQSSQVVPLGVLTAAFRSLALHLLGLPAEEVAQWRSRLSRALHGYEALAASGTGTRFTDRQSAGIVCGHFLTGFPRTFQPYGTEPVNVRHAEAARWCC